MSMPAATSASYRWPIPASMLAPLSFRHTLVVQQEAQDTLDERVVQDWDFDAEFAERHALAPVYVEGLPSGKLRVVEVLVRVLLWLPAQDEDLLSVSRVSRGWRAASSRLPQWSVTPRVVAAHRAVKGYPKELLTVYEGQLPRLLQEGTRDEYAATIKARLGAPAAYEAWISGPVPRWLLAAQAGVAFGVVGMTIAIAWVVGAHSEGLVDLKACLATAFLPLGVPVGFGVSRAVAYCRTPRAVLTWRGGGVLAGESALGVIATACVLHFGTPIGVVVNDATVEGREARKDSLLSLFVGLPVVALTLSVVAAAMLRQQYVRMGSLVAAFLLFNPSWAVAFGLRCMTLDAERRDGCLISDRFARPLFFVGFGLMPFYHIVAILALLIKVCFLCEKR